MRSRQNFTDCSNVTGSMSFPFLSDTHVPWGVASTARRLISVGEGLWRAILDEATAQSLPIDIVAAGLSDSLLFAIYKQSQPFVIIPSNVLDLSIGQTIKFLANGNACRLDGLHEAVRPLYLGPIP